MIQGANLISDKMYTLSVNVSNVDSSIKQEILFSTIK